MSVEREPVPSRFGSTTCRQARRPPSRGTATICPTARAPQPATSPRERGRCSHPGQQVLQGGVSRPTSSEVIPAEAKAARSSCGSKERMKISVILLARSSGRRSVLETSSEPAIPVIRVIRVILRLSAALQAPADPRSCPVVAAFLPRLPLGQAFSYRHEH